jgi:hypothetical protein
MDSAQDLRSQVSCNSGCSQSADVLRCSDIDRDVVTNPNGQSGSLSGGFTYRRQ